MNANLAMIASDLAALARERGWHDVARLAESACTAEGEQVVAVVQLLDGDARGLAGWVRRTTPAARVVELDGASDQAVTEGWLADRLLAAFPCGGLPTTEIIQGLASGPILRPPPTFAVALTGADQISSAEDLTLVETTARKWLLPPTSSAQTAGELSDAGAYLWTNAPLGDPNLGARVGRDCAALVRWLTSSLRPETVSQLAQARLSQALKRASEENQRSQTAIPGLDRKRHFAAAEDLAAIRTRVLTRLRSDIDAQVEALRVAVDDLEADLLDGLNIRLRPYLAQHPEAATSQQAVRKLIENYCKETLDQWENAKPPRLTAQWQSAIREIEQLIRDADWSVVNAIPDATGVYPDRLLQRLGRDSLSTERRAPDVSVGSPIPGAPGVASPSGVVKTVGAAFVGCVAGALTGLGSVGMVVGGGLATAVSVGYQMQSSRAASHAAVLDYARQVIAANIPATRDQLIQHLERTTDSLRQDIAKEFDQAEARLNKNQPLSAASVATSSERLAELQEKFKAINLQT